MLHLRYSTAFWTCFEFRIYPLNILGFWIYQDIVIDIWQYSEYALNSEYSTALNMLGSLKVMNKIFHQKYLTGFWICLEFWKCQCYTGFCRLKLVTHVSQVFKYSLGSQFARALIYKGREYANVTYSSA